MKRKLEKIFQCPDCGRVCSETSAAIEQPVCLFPDIPKYHGQRKRKPLKSRSRFINQLDNIIESFLKYANIR